MGKRPIMLSPLPREKAAAIEGLRIGARIKVTELEKVAETAAPMLVGKIAARRGGRHNNAPKRYRISQCRAGLLGGLEICGHAFSRKGVLGKRDFSLGPLDWYDILQEEAPL